MCLEDLCLPSACSEPGPPAALLLPRGGDTTHLCAVLLPSISLLPFEGLFPASDFADAILSAQVTTVCRWEHTCVSLWTRTYKFGNYTEMAAFFWCGYRVAKTKLKHRAEGEVPAPQFSVDSLILKQGLDCEEMCIYLQGFPFPNPGNSKMCMGPEVIFLNLFLLTAWPLLLHS